MRSIFFRRSGQRGISAACLSFAKNAKEIDRLEIVALLTLYETNVGLNSASMLQRYYSVVQPLEVALERGA